MRVALERLREVLKKPEYIFAVVAAIFGLIAVFVIPPGWNSDEYQHFFRVEQFTEGELFSTDESGNKTDKAGGYIDSNAVSFMNSVGRFADNSDNREKLSPLSLLKDSPRYSAEGEKTYVQFNGSALYSPLTYIPQITGVLLAKFFDAPVYVSILLARLFGLALYILAIFWAIRIMPKGKWILMTIALLATSVVQGAALGADAVTCSSIAFFISYVFYLAYGKKDINLRRAAILLCLMVVVGLIKPTYFMLLPLVLVIPLCNDKYYTPRFAAKLIAMMAIAVVPALAWIALINYVGHNGGEGTDKVLQAQYIIHHPVELVATIVRTYFGTTVAGSWNHFYDVAFRNFVWDIVQFSKAYSYLAVIAIILSLGIKDPIRLAMAKPKKAMHHGVLIGAFLATFALINVALYLQFTPVESKVVYGVQARYLFPFLILLLLPLQSVAKNQIAAKYWLLSILLVCLAASTIAIYKNIHYFAW